MGFEKIANLRRPQHQTYPDAVLAWPFSCSDATIREWRTVLRRDELNPKSWAGYYELENRAISKASNPL